MLIRFIQRILIFALGLVCVWLIAFVVFPAADKRLPTILAAAATYGLAAYIVLPYAVRMGLKVQQHRHVPAFTVTGDGLPGDPVNVALIGTLAQLEAAFAAAGWFGADKLSLKSSIGMAQAFVRNTPYPTAPFSTLFLFGRPQDIGFQKAINNSPRKRHHIRFWAMSLPHAESMVGKPAFWMNTDRPPDDKLALWIGAGTRDTGLSLTRLTFQITHATDSDTNIERDFVVSELQKCGGIGNVRLYPGGERLSAGTVNHYLTDGEVAVAELAHVGRMRSA
jgi:hypothetical protein